ncbi:hypothetical protein MAHJHV34_47860 [Mycobacterium avium subsp. hominissuis]
MLDALLVGSVRLDARISRAMWRHVDLNDFVLLKLRTFIDIAEPHRIQPYPLRYTTVDANARNAHGFIVFQ